VIRPHGMSSILLPEMIHAAVTGEGLQAIRDNAEYQRIAWGVALRKNRMPVLRFENADADGANPGDSL